MGYCLWGRKKLDMTERLTLSLFKEIFILINCKKDSDHPFHKSYRKNFQSSREPAQLLLRSSFVRFLDGWGAVESRVCDVLLM